MIASFAETSRGLFAIGSNGVAWKRDDNFHLLAFIDPDFGLGVTGLVEAPNRDIWINGLRGIVRITGNEIDAALRNPNHKIAGERVTEGNFVGPASFTDLTPSLLLGADGKLWFSTLNGVVSVDPDHTHSLASPPKLVIRLLSADGQAVQQNGTIAPKPEVFEIQYTGVNLTDPQKVIYRYKLEGLDKTWQEAGHRTEAVYTRLPPGRYTFQVIGSNGDGRWTPPLSSQSFTVLPVFYETWLFALLAGMAGVLFFLVDHYHSYEVCRRCDSDTGGGQSRRTQTHCSGITRHIIAGCPGAATQLPCSGTEY